MLFLGIFQLSIPYGLVFWGEQYIPSGLSAVLFATCPFFVVMFGHLIGQEKLTGFKAAGVLFSFGGLVAIFWRDIATLSVGGLASFLGSVAVVGSAASAGLANVVAKRHADLIDPSMNVLVQSIICTVVLLALALFTELNTPLVLSLTAVEAILYLGIVGSALAFVGMY
jgi:drug/metabolite transporter (DMT)-like permease